MIEHYSSGIKRIKKECDQNGNDYPILHNEMGTFSTTYLPRKADDTINAINDTTKHDSDPINEPVNEPVNEEINGRHEEINGRHEEINGRHEEINGRHEEINSRHEEINGRHEEINGRHEEINGRHEEINEDVKKIFTAIKAKPGIKRLELQKIIGKRHATIDRAIELLKSFSQIEYRGSKKTGGYYAIEQK